jgi:hypothetical protein
MTGDLNMDAHEIAKALSGFRLPYKGSDQELQSELFAKNRSLNIPSNVRAFRLALKALTPELLALGVAVKIFDTGKIHITTATEARKDAAEEKRLRDAFNSALGVEFRLEFGTFERFYAFRRALAEGVTHQPIRGTNVLASQDRDAGVDVDQHLPIDARCRAVWKRSPETRAAFSSYEAYERALANGQARQFAPSA